MSLSEPDTSLDDRDESDRVRRRVRTHFVNPPETDPSRWPAVSEPAVSLSNSSKWFDEEVHPHEGALRAFLGRKLASRADVDDVVQDSYLKLWRSRVSGFVHSPKAYLFKIARNAVIDLRRRRDVAVAEPITESAPLPVLEDAPGVVDLVSRQQELALLNEAIHALPARCQQVFLLRKIQGLSQREIAARLGITENTVETLVGRGARHCADYLRERGVGKPATP